MKRFLAFVFLSACVTAGYTQSRSVITGSNYNKKKDRTEYFVLPYGSIHLPGRWKKGQYIQSSRQQGFYKDSVFVNIALLPCDKFEFSKPGLEGFELVKAYYNWDARYFSNNLKMNTPVLFQDSISNYIIWKASGNNIENVFLFGARGCGVFNISVSTLKWTDEQKISFLQELYSKRE